jgi:hypothetical protein
MAVISFAEASPDAAWVVAGWAFRQVLADVMIRCPDDAEIVAILQRAEAVKYLMLEYLDRPLAVRLAASIEDTAAGVLAGTLRSGIEDRFHDDNTTKEYLKGLRMLLDAAQVGRGLPVERDGKIK